MTIPAAIPIHLYVSGPTPTTMRTACGASLTEGQAWRATTDRGGATCPACRLAQPADDPTGVASQDVAALSRLSLADIQARLRKELPR